MARVGGQSPVRGSFVRRPSVPWCWGFRWLKGVSSTLEAEQRSPRPASYLPPAEPGFRLFLVSFAGASAPVGGETGKDNGLTFQVWCQGWGSSGSPRGTFSQSLPHSDPHGAGGCPQSLLSLGGPCQCCPSWTRKDCVFFCTVIIPLSSPPSLLTSPFN